MMVSKTLIHKEVYNITSQKDIPNLSVEKIAQIISSNPKALSTYSKYELDQFPVKFKNIMEGTRKDLTLHYSIKGAKTVYKDPAEFEGIKYYDTISYEESENTTLKVDYVSFFTKPKDNINEHRIYQIGPRYSNKEKRTLETLLRKKEKERDIVATINILRKILKINPNEYKKWNRLGELFVKTKQYDNAIEACKKSIESVGMNPDGWICLGMAYYGKGDIEKATKFFKKTLDDYDPGSFPWYFRAIKHLAQIHFNAEEYEKALEYCNQHLDYDYFDNKKNSKEIFKLEKIIKQKLGIQEESPKEKTESQKSKEHLQRLVQRLCDDNNEYIESLKRFDVKDLKYNAEGKVIDDEGLVFYREAIIKFFEKKFIKAYIDANRDKKDFRIFVDDVYPKLVSELEVFYGLNIFINLITNLISNTKDVAYIYSPIVFQELLSFVSEWGFKNEDKKIVFYSFWEEELHDKIFSSMNKLGNIQVRRLGYPFGYYVALRDEKELILTPFSSNLEDIISIKSTDGEFINFYKTILIPILNGASKPINFEELKVINNINKFLDDLL